MLLSTTLYLTAAWSPSPTFKSVSWWRSSGTGVGSFCASPSTSWGDSSLSANNQLSSLLSKWDSSSLPLQRTSWRDSLSESKRRLFLKKIVKMILNWSKSNYAVPESIFKRQTALERTLCTWKCLRATGSRCGDTRQSYRLRSTQHSHWSCHDAIFVIRGVRAFILT